jgi:hypothetical protein
LLTLMSPIAIVKHFSATTPTATPPPLTQPR